MPGREYIPGLRIHARSSLSQTYANITWEKVLELKDGTISHPVTSPTGYLSGFETYCTRRNREAESVWLQSQLPPGAEAYSAQHTLLSRFHIKAML